MVGLGLKNYSAQLGFNKNKNCVYGPYNGYSVTMSEGLGYKKIMIGAVLEGSELQNEVIVFIETNSKQFSITEYGIHPSHIEIYLHDSWGTMKKLKQVLDNLISLLERADVPGASVCWYCMTSFNEDATKIEIDGAVLQMHKTCIDSLERNEQHASEELKNESKMYISGTIGAVLGGLIGVIPWVAAYFWGFFVGWLGFLIGISAKKGYELLGGRPGKAKPWIVAAIVVFSVLFGQFVTLNIEVYYALLAEGITDLELIEIPLFVIELLKEYPEYSRVFFSDIALGLLFAFLGIYGLFKDLVHEGKGKLKKIDKLDEACESK